MALKLIGGSFPVSMQIVISGASQDKFEAVNNGLSTTDRIGWLLQRVEDYTDPTPAAVPSGFQIAYGITLTNSVLFQNVSIQGILNTPQYKWVQTFSRRDIGTAATSERPRLPKVYSFNDLPDGGLLMVPQPLYVFGSSDSGLAATVTVMLRAYFQAVQLTDADYFQLLQANQLLTA